MARTIDPYTSFNYLVEIAGIRIGEFQEVSGLVNESEVVTCEEGGENTYVHQFRGQNKYTNLTLKHGVTRLSPAIWAWRQSMIHRKTPPMLDMMLILLDDRGEEYTRWSLRNCQPVKWVGPDLKGGENQIAVETLEIAYDSFQILEVTPPERDPQGRNTAMKVSLVPERGAGQVGKAVTFRCECTQGEPPNDFKWTVEGQPVTGDQQMSHTFDKIGQFKVECVARNGKGEEDTAKGVAVISPGPFEVKIDPDKKTVQAGDKLKFKGVDVKGDPATRWTWTLSGGGPATGQEIEDSFPTEGRYEVRLVAGNAHGQESQSRAEILVEKRKDLPEIKLTPIGPGAQQDFSTWVYYHHAMFYFELEMKNVAKVELAISGGGSPSPYITGIWKQASAGSVAAKGGAFDMGSPGKIEDPSTHDARCYYKKTAGTHPNTSIYDLIDSKPKTYDFSASERWVIAIYSRGNGTGILTARGLPPFPNSQAKEPVKAQASWTMSGHQRPGD